MASLVIRVALGGALALAPVLATDAPAPPAPAPGPSGQLRGLVSYGRHDPAVGAVVGIRPEGASSPLRFASTGENGAFAFDHLEDGTYRTEVRRDGYVPVVKTGIVVKSPFRAVVELLLQRGADASSRAPAPAPASGAPVRVAGTVRFTSGAPVPEARVRLARLDGTDDPRLAVTRIDGGFAIEGLGTGPWRVEILGAGLLPLRTTLDLAVDTALDAMLAPQPANYQPLPEDLIVPEDVIPPRVP